MEKRDLIQAEIEKLGYFLQRLLANFLNGNSTENSIEAADLVTNEFKNELDFDLPHFVSLSNIEMNSSKKHLTKALELLDLVDEISNSYSFERNNKKIKIQQFLNQ